MSGERDQDDNAREGARSAAELREGGCESVTLHRGFRPMISLDKAVAAVATELDGAVVFLYTPGGFFIGKLQEGVVRHPDGVVNLLDAFEARLFNATHELRWLHAKAGPGKAVLVTEKALPDDWAEESPPSRFAGYQSVTYLLWGEAVPSAKETQALGSAPAVDAAGWPEDPGWTTLHEARIGPRTVPVSCRRGGRALLEGREYIEKGDYGNAAVTEERLMALVAEESSTPAAARPDAGLEGLQ